MVLISLNLFFIVLMAVLLQQLYSDDVKGVKFLLFFIIIMLLFVGNTVALLKSINDYYNIGHDAHVVEETVAL